MLSVDFIKSCFITVELIDSLGVHGIQVVPFGTLGLSPAVEAREVAQVLGLKDLARVHIPGDVILTVDSEGHLYLRFRTCFFPSSAFTHDSESDKRLLRAVFQTVRVVERF